MTRLQDECQKLKDSNLDRETTKPKSFWERIFGPSVPDTYDPDEAYFASAKEAAARERARARASRIREISEQLMIELAKNMDHRVERVSPPMAAQCLEQATRIYELSHMTENPNL